MQVCFRWYLVTFIWFFFQLLSRSVLLKKVLLKISQISQESACLGVSATLLNLFQLGGEGRRDPPHLPFQTFLHYSETREASKSKFRDFSENLSPNIFTKNVWKVLHQWAPQGSKVASWYFQKFESSGYITYYIPLESIFFTDFKKGIRNSDYLT